MQHLIHEHKRARPSGAAAPGSRPTGPSSPRPHHCSTPLGCAPQCPAPGSTPYALCQPCHAACMHACMSQRCTAGTQPAGRVSGLQLQAAAREQGGNKGVHVHTSPQAADAQQTGGRGWINMVESFGGWVVDGSTTHGVLVGPAAGWTPRAAAWTTPQAPLYPAARTNDDKAGKPNGWHNRPSTVGDVPTGDTRGAARPPLAKPGARCATARRRPCWDTDAGGAATPGARQSQRVVLVLCRRFPPIGCCRRGGCCDGRHGCKPSVHVHAGETTLLQTQGAGSTPLLAC